MTNTPNSADACGRKASSVPHGVASIASSSIARSRFAPGDAHVDAIDALASTAGCFRVHDSGTKSSSCPEEVEESTTAPTPLWTPFLIDADASITRATTKSSPFRDDKSLDPALVVVIAPSFHDDVRTRAVDFTPMHPTTTKTTATTRTIALDVPRRTVRGVRDVAMKSPARSSSP